MPSAIVTGSSRGIGRAIALWFAEDGHDVAVEHHTSDEAADEVAPAVRETGQDAVVEADVSDPAPPAGSSSGRSTRSSFETRFAISEAIRNLRSPRTASTSS